MNEDQIIHRLGSNGFEIIVPSRLSFEEEVDVFRCANLIVGPLGAGLLNAIYCENKAAVISFGARSYQDFGHLTALFSMTGHLHGHLFCDEFDGYDPMEKSYRNTDYWCSISMLEDAIRTLSFDGM